MFDKYSVKITLLRGMLGTNPIDPNVLDTHIIEKQRKMIAGKGNQTKLSKYLDAKDISEERKQEEIDKIKARAEQLNESIDEVETRGTTGFFWDSDGKCPLIGDHMILGFLKAASDAIAATLPTKKGTVLYSAAYTHSMINMHVAVEPRFIPVDTDILRNEDGTPNYLQRSLRAKTAQGPRISLAKSEQIPAGASMEFELLVMKDSPITENVLRRLFDYGQLKGLAQWRNVGWGQFKYELSVVD